MPADDELTRAANLKGVSKTAARYSYPQLGFKKPALAPGQFGIGTAGQYSIGANKLLDRFPPDECERYIRHSGYFQSG
uniref:hypothetical protein n=1 Tax=Polaromonas sp. H6N TaxID=1840293 RepID=UPI0015E7FF1A|nr:hypothetical protein [Polaromonas sp. H6N]